MIASMLTQTNPDLFLNYLLMGYGVMWLIALAYVISLAVQQRNMRRDIVLLKQLLEEMPDE